MELGSMVDEALSAESLDAIGARWSVRTLKRDDPELFERQKANPESVVSEAQMEKALEMARTVLDSTWYREDADRNPIYQMPIMGSVVTPEGPVQVSFMPDHVIIDSSEDGERLRITVTDWKTSAPADCRSPWAWRRKCERYGYFRQFALARFIFRQIFPMDGLEFVFRHAVIESVRDGRYRDHLFLVPESLLAPAHFELVEAVREISRCLKLGESAFVDETPSWHDAVEL